MYSIFSLILLHAWSGSTASAQISSIRVFYDVNGMPRCLEDTSQPQSGKGAGVLFRWDHRSRYSTTVEALDLRTVGIPARYILGPPRCENWASLSSVWFGSRQNITHETQSVFGMPLSAKIRQALLQIERGGKVFHAELTGQEYLSNHPIQEFDINVDKKLTRAFGIGFVSEIFKAWIRADETNHHFANQVASNMREASFAANPKVRHAENIKVIMEPGLGQDPKDIQDHLPVNLIDFLGDLGAIGLDWEVLKNEPYKAIKVNVPIIKRALHAALEAGREVVLIGQSKGMPEVFAAVGELEREYHDSGHRPRGKILAFINLSGVVQGSWVADFAIDSHIAPTLAVGAMLSPLSRLQRVDHFINHLFAIMDMSSYVCIPLLKEYGPWLPRDAVYINLIGTVPGDGLANTKNGVIAMGIVEKIQTIFSKVAKNYGANDGYVEYPQMLLPKELGLNQKSLVFDASHYIFDGTLDGVPMYQTKSRREILVGLFQAFLE